MHDSSVVRDSNNLFAMDQRAARTVVRPPKPGATPSMSDDQRDDLEHRVRCQCGCTLDVYTCRTTDFSCEVSPSMHRDIMALVKGGYSAQEIVDAFVGSYGEQVLMAPRKSGFNLLAWFTPGLAVIVGGRRRFRRCCGGGAAAQQARRSGGPRRRRRPVRSTRRPTSWPRLDAAIKGEDALMTALVIGTLLAIAALAFVLYPVFFGAERRVALPVARSADARWRQRRIGAARDRVRPGDREAVGHRLR